MNNTTIIKSVQNEKIKEISKLKHKKNRLDQNRFLINGIKCSYEFLKLKTIYQEFENCRQQKVGNTKEQTDSKLDTIYFNDIILNGELEYIILEESIYSKYMEYIISNQNMKNVEKNIEKNIESNVKIKIYEYIEKNQSKIMIVSKEVFHKLTEHKNFEGIALCIKYIYDKNENVQKSICKIIEKIKLNNNLNNNSNDNIIVLENVNDPGNLGSVLRTMSATGNKLLILIGDCVSQFSEKVIRSSMGAVFKIDILNISLYEFEKFVKQEYVQNNYITIGTSIDGENLYTNSIENVDNYNKNSYENTYENTSKNIFKNILIFGNEANGLSAEMFKLVKNKIMIPMEKNVESLNLAISVAIILYELYRRQNYCAYNTNNI